MRATPPSTRMSAGTRSSAITATAPASSAIRACSASTTSMITPPFSISARPVFTRMVPSSSIARSLVGLAGEAVVACKPPEELGERCPFLLGEALEVDALDSREVRPRRGAKLVEALVGEPGVADARVGLALGTLHVSGALEPGKEPRDPGGSEQDLLGELDPLQPFGLPGEPQQHLVVVDRQPVLRDQIRGEFSRHGRVRAEKSRPRRKFELGRNPCAHLAYMVRAVDASDLEVAEGEIYGFLGPNGAGKSTTVHMLTTLLPPTEGRAVVGGFDVLREGPKVRETIGAALQEAALDPFLTGRDHIRLQASLHGMSRAQRRQRGDELLERVGLTDAADRKVRTYSGGMKRRLDLALALLHGPSILFLDEPTTGLDPQSRNALWIEVARLAREDGVTVFLTTQYLEEADVLADRVGIIDRGDRKST